MRTRGNAGRGGSPLAASPRQGSEPGGLPPCALVAPTTMRVAKAALGALRLKGSGLLPPLFALVTGMVAGRPTTVSCHVTSLPSGMAGATSVPAALAAGQLLAELLPPGVHAPEAVIDADRLLADLVPLCPTPVADVDALAPLRIVG